MIKRTIKTDCDKLGLVDGQMREPYIHKNLWWSFDLGETSFGYGDLDQDDLDRILEWVKEHDDRTRPLVFTGWNEHHDTEWQQTPVPMIRITALYGIVFPNTERQAQRRS